MWICSSNAKRTRTCPITWNRCSSWATAAKKKDQGEIGMGRSEPDFVKKKFAPLLDKTLKNALAHKLGKEFPRLGGPRILNLCAEMILETTAQHMRSRES